MMGLGSIFFDGYSRGLAQNLRDVNYIVYGYDYVLHIRIRFLQFRMILSSK